MQLKKVNLNEICRDYGICTASFDNAVDFMKSLGLDPATSAGYSVMTQRGEPVILFDSHCSDREVRFTNGYLNQHLAAAEREADSFAVILLAHDFLCRYGTEVPT